jgi:AraC-like DNA-binding protein
MALGDGLSVTSDARSADLSRQPTHWARFAGHIVSLARDRGADADALCRAAGLHGVDLWAPDERVPLVSVYALVEAAAEVVGTPLFGVTVASSVDVELLDALGFLVLTSPTFGVAMERTIRYQRIWNDGERYVLAIEDDRAHLRYDPYGPSRPAHRHMAEMFAYDVGVNAPRLVASPDVPVVVRLRAEPPSDRAAYEAAFGAPVEFSAPIDEVVLPLALFDQPMPQANAAMHAFFLRYAEAALARLGPASSLGDRVRAFVGDHLSDGRATLPLAAQALGSSARTLQRRLQAEGTSFEALVEGVRRARALALLDAWMSIGEVAYLLGYAEASVFHRAFKRWTGTSPEAWRAAHIDSTSDASSRSGAAG